MNKKLIWISLGVLIVLSLLFGGLFAVIDSVAIAKPTQQECFDEANSLLQKYSDDPAFYCSAKCVPYTRETTTVIPPRSDYWGWGTYSYISDGQYYYDDNGIIQVSVSKYDSLSQYVSGSYTVEWKTSCYRDYSVEDKTARSVCSTCGSASCIVGIDEADYITFGEFANSDVYYMSDLDKFYGSLKDSCRSDEVCRQSGTQASCVSQADACSPSYSYFCSYSRVISDDSCGNTKVVDDCTSEDKRCVGGESTCESLQSDSSVFDGVDNSGEQINVGGSGEDFTNTGSDSDGGRDSGGNDEGVAKISLWQRFIDWMKGLFSL